MLFQYHPSIIKMVYYGENITKNNNYKYVKI